MRDLVSKLFGFGQEDEAPSESPEKASEKGSIKQDAAPAASPPDDTKNQLINESSPIDLATTDQQLEQGSKDMLVNDTMMADVSESEMHSIDEALTSDSDTNLPDQGETQPSAIEETAISLKQVKIEEIDKPSAVLQAVQCCHIGIVRSRNEDSTYIFTAEAGGQEPMIPFGLYIVADGMGGHHAGHEASRAVSRIVAQNVLSRIYLPLLKKSTERSGQSQEPIRDIMLDAIQVANQKIHNPEPGSESGTTLTAALILGSRLYITQVGDSRAYLLRDDKLNQVTVDHSYVRRLIDAGDLTEEEAAVHPKRNMLYKAVGQGSSLEIDTFTQTLTKKGTLILCSDGLWGLVSDAAITEVVQKDSSLSDRANELVTMGLQAGGHDNISVVLVSFNL